MSGSPKVPVSGLGYFSFDSYGAQVDGSDTVSTVRIGAFARRNTPDRPHGVVNDYVASALGMAIGLPVPPGLLVQVGNTGYGYVSMQFGVKGDALPPVIFPQFAAERTWEAWGVIAFDQWVYNTDRHNGNLAHLPQVGVSVFDHDLALLARASGDIAKVLREHRDEELKKHALPPHMDDSKFMESWCERIAGIRTAEITRIVHACKHAKLIDDPVADELVQYIDHRKAKVREYIHRTKSEYVKISEWPFGDEVSDVR